MAHLNDVLFELTSLIYCMTLCMVVLLC